MRRSSAVPLGRSYLALAALVTTAGLASACSRSRDEQVYCADDNGVVVDDYNCDDAHGSRGGYNYYRGSYGSGLRSGMRLPGGGVRIPPGDSAARSRNGLPGTGKVSNGHVVSGGFGGSGSSGHGSSSSGHGSSGS